MTKPASTPASYEVGIVLYAGAQPAAVHGLTDLLAVAEALALEQRPPAARLRITHWHPAASGAPGAACVFDSAPGQPPRPEILIVPPTMVDLPQPEANERLARWLLERHAAGVTLASVCSGIYVLAATGLLDGRVASTHQSFATTLAAAFPRIRIDLDRCIVDHGDVITAGGFMAWIDIGLMLVERYLGPSLRTETARFMLSDATHRRQDYFAGFPPSRAHGDEAVRKAQEWIHGRDGIGLTLGELAARAGLGKRTFQRRFFTATGMAPADYCRQVRAARARELLEASNAPIKVIAESLGYQEVPSFTRSFRRHTGQTPAAYRRQFGIAAAAAPS